MGAHTYKVKIKTNHGNVNFVIWDTAGQEKFGGLIEGYFIKARYAVLFLDVGQKQSLTQGPTWVTKFRRIEPTAHFVVAGNKADLTPKKITENAVIFFMD